MISEHRYNLFGYRFSFCTNVPRASDLVAQLYVGRGDTTARTDVPTFRLLHDPDQDHEEEWRVDAPGVTALPKPTFGDAMYAVEACITGELTRFQHVQHVVHGGVVYGPEGDLLLTGNSGAGKTTLSLALTSRGLRVGCDDMAMLDPSSGQLQPHPRCFHIDDRSAGLLAELGVSLPPEALRDQFVIPADLGVEQLLPARLRFVFLLESERLEEPKIVPETQANAVATLLMQTGKGQFSGLEGVQAMTLLVGSASCFRLWSGDLQDTVNAVCELADPSAI
jgi:hypothetical protein